MGWDTIQADHGTCGPGRTRPWPRPHSWARSLGDQTSKREGGEVGAGPAGLGGPAGTMGPRREGAQLEGDGTGLGFRDDTTSGWRTREGQRMEGLPIESGPRHGSSGPRLGCDWISQVTASLRV